MSHAPIDQSNVQQIYDDAYANECHKKEINGCLLLYTAFLKFGEIKHVTDPKEMDEIIACTETDRDSEFYNPDYVPGAFYKNIQTPMK